MLPRQIRHQRLTRALACVALVVLPGHALADPAGDLLKQAIKRYIGVDFRGSLGLLERARDATSDPRLLGKIHLYLGCNHAEMGQDAWAREAFGAALGHAPALDLDPQFFKPSLVKMFRQVRRGMYGEILVTADDPEAVVLLDGKEVGTVPFRGKVCVGKHTVEVRWGSGDAREERAVVVAPGKLSRVNLAIEPLKGRLTVRSTPPGATVLLDGEMVGVTPLEGKTVDAGIHRVTIIKAGHGDLVRYIKVAPRGEAWVEVNLKKPGPAVEPKEAPVGAPRRRQLWTWIAAGGAVATAAVGIGLGASVLADGQEYESLTAGQQERYYELESSVPDRALAANVLFGVAGALAVTTVVLFFLEGRPPGGGGTVLGPETRLAPVVGDGPGLLLTTWF